MTLFAYGTLLVPEIWRGVAGRDCPSRPATLSGHSIYRVKGADFPGIVTSGSADTVPGRIFSKIDSAIIARLDAYEDVFYERLEVSVRDGNGNSIQAQTYVIPDRHREILSNERWTLEWFEREAMDGYLIRHGFHG